jgi:NADPH:quinone reductase-like Zn-dependent oxidoreductase
MQAVLKTEDGRFALHPVAEPERAEDGLLVAVEAFSLNFGEVNYAQANGKVPGWDAAGRVLETPDAERWPVGARVLTFGWGGAWAERRAAAVGECALIPDAVETGAAAALPVAGVTALRALRHGGDLNGKRVLVTGASGGVGRFAIQIGRELGAHIVALVGRPERGVGLDALGAGEILVGVEGLVDPVDLVLDNVGGDLLLSILEHTTPDAPVLSIGGASGQRGDRMDAAKARVTSFYMGEGLAEDLALLLRWSAEGVLDPQIGWRTAWTRIDEATKALLGRQIAGKAVLDVTAAS